MTDITSLFITEGSVLIGGITSNIWLILQAYLLQKVHFSSAVLQVIYDWYYKPIYYKRFISHRRYWKSLMTDITSHVITERSVVIYGITSHVITQRSVVTECLIRLHYTTFSCHRIINKTSLHNVQLSSMVLKVTSLLNVQLSLNVKTALHNVQLLSIVF